MDRLTEIYQTTHRAVTEILCDHEWQEIERPRGNSGGWHVDKCIKCGKVNEYDTSD